MTKFIPINQINLVTTTMFHQYYKNVNIYPQVVLFEIEESISRSGDEALRDLDLAIIVSSDLMQTNVLSWNTDGELLSIS